MPAKQIAHGTIEITAPKATYTAKVAAQPVANPAAGIHAVSTGAAPAAVVQHKTASEIEAEAAQLAKDVAAAQT